MTSPAVRVAYDGEGVRVFSWTLTPAAIGEKVSIAGHRRLSVFVCDLKGTGAVAVEISPDPEGQMWVTAHDGQGNGLVGLRQGAVETVVDHALWLRPVVGRGVEKRSRQVTTGFLISRN